jgi:hypothetical protein
MSELKDFFGKQIWDLPYPESLKFGKFVASWYPEEKIFRYGAFYIQDADALFYLLVEIMNPLPDFSSCEKSWIGGMQIQKGYVPDYPLITKEIVKSFRLERIDTFSWVHRDKVFTFVAIDKEMNTNQFIKLLFDAEPVGRREELARLFGRYENLPDSHDEWILVSIIHWYSTVVDEDGKTHWVIHLQGNYRHDSSFINLEIRFGCSHRISIEELSYPELEPADIKEKGTLAIRHALVCQFANYFYVNEARRFSLRCTEYPAGAGDQEVMVGLMTNLIEQLEMPY